MTPRIHCVRHAQGYHNISVENHSMRDPELTPYGIEQCRDLARKFPYHKNIDLVVASPLTRTLNTALFTFGDDIKERNLTIVALPQLQESSDLPCDTGSEVADAKKKFEGKPIDWSMMTDDWCSKKGKYSPEAKAVEARAREARQWLMQRPEKDIVLVTHGGFLHYFTEEWTGFNPAAGTGWTNTEYRSYEFSSHDTPNAHLVETTESHRRRYPDAKPLDTEEQTQLNATTQAQQATEIQAKA